MLDRSAELLAKIRLGEDSLLELKEVRVRNGRVSAPAREDVADELAAFANTNGGVLVLGVEDGSREVLGIPLDALDQAETLIRDVCSDSIRPPLLCSIVRLELPDSLGQLRAVLKVDVPRSVFVHQSPGGYVHRIGSSRRLMPPEYLQRLFQLRSQVRLVSFDEQPVRTTGWADLDWAALAAHLPSGSGEDRLTARKLNVVSEADGQEHLTVAGLLLFGLGPQLHLPNAVIDAALYRGTERDSNYQEDARLCAGTLDRQIDAALSFVQHHQRVRATKAPHRVDHPEYDARALFEAITNAVVHRDYSLGGSKIRLFMFSNRIELHVPGQLPNSVTIDTLPDRQATRNELIVRFLSRTPVAAPLVGLRKFYMEARGEGVPLILRRSTDLSGRRPDYALHGEELQLTIFAAPEPER